VLLRLHHQTVEVLAIKQHLSDLPAQRERQPHAREVAGRLEVPEGPGRYGEVDGGAGEVEEPWL
jgi:hypothetical protein